MHVGNGAGVYILLQLYLGTGIAIATIGTSRSPNHGFTLGCWALGYTDSGSLAMAGIVIDDQDDIDTVMGLARCIRNIINTIGTVVRWFIRLSSLTAWPKPSLLRSRLPSRRLGCQHRLFKIS